MTTTELDDDYIALQDALADAHIIDLANPMDPCRDERWVTAMLRSIKAMDAEVAKIALHRSEHINAAMAEASGFKAREFTALAREVENRTAVLEAWAIERRRETGDATFAYPGGSIKTREAVKWVWPTDVSPILDQLALAPELLRMRTELNKDAIKAAALIKDGAVLIHGEPLEGVTATETITAKVTVAG